MKKLIAAGGLAAVALFMLLGFLSSDAAGGGAATFVALLLVVGLPATGAVLLARSHYSESSRITGRRALLRQQTLDAEILRLAGQNAGRLTIVEVASQLAVPMESAKEALDGLMLRNHADLEITEEGLSVYTFYDVKHLGGKHSSKGVLDA